MLTFLDGGSTHWRLYELDSAGELASVSELAPTSLDGLMRLRKPDHHHIASGMLTSATGVYETAYRSTPCALACPVADREYHQGWTFLPGVVDHVNQDMMRGEDVQILGAYLSRGDGWYVVPGTHTKWVEVVDAQILQIRTFPTGELRAALLNSPSLCFAAGAESDESAADFLERAPDQLDSLVFWLRYQWQHQGLSASDVNAGLTQWLIKHEIKRAEGFVSGPVALVSDRTWAQAYRRCWTGSDPMVAVSNPPWKGYLELLKCV